MPTSQLNGVLQHARCDGLYPGAHWSDVGAGLPAGSFVSMVRADPQRAGLLYAGTNDSAFVSLDDGDHWQSLQRDLPAAWVRDLLVHDSDLIAATQGRAIWILDDRTPLRQATTATLGAPVHPPLHARFDGARARQREPLHAAATGHAAGHEPACRRPSSTIT